MLPGVELFRESDGGGSSAEVGQLKKPEVLM